MRNPAPVVLTLLLAAAAIFFMVRQPDPAPDREPPAATESNAEAAADENSASPAPDTAEVEPRPWPQENSDLPADEKAVFGHLDNGMRYIIYPNEEPPDRVSVRLHIAAGSLMEAEDQRGLAHFLEHMVFNGTENFSPDELIPRMQRLGIAFGAHVNAYTSFDETVYMLDLPETGDDMLDLGFTVMRDFADRALLETEEIDKERGVILSEKTTRDSVDYRLMQKQFSTLLPDSLVAKRFPIGEEEVIREAPRERFVDFYEKYYTPRRMTFVVVGDVEPGAAEERVRETFGGMTQPADPGEDPELGDVSPEDGFEAHVFSDDEVDTTELDLLAINRYQPEPDTREKRAERLRLSLAHSILGLRFEEISRGEDSPIRGGSASRSDLFNHLRLGSVNVSVAEDRWRDAVPVLEREFRRALEHGFTRAEFVEAKANVLNAYQQAVKTKETHRSPQIATGIARTVASPEVLTSPETDLAVVESALEDLAPEDCHAAFTDFWRPRTPRLILVTNSPPEGAKEELGTLYRESRETEVEPPEETEVKSFAYTDFGQPGEVRETERFEELDVTRLTFANGVVVNLKPTDFEQNRIRLKARVGHGKLTQPGDKIGLGEFTTAVMQGGGIGVHPVDELRQIFAGRNVSVGFSVEEDHFALAGATTPEDLQLQLRAMTAKLLHPGYREEAVRQFRKSVPMTFQQLRHTLAGPMRDMSGWLRGNDPRFEFPDDPETLLAYGLDDARSWLEPEFTNGEIELNLVGDFDPEAVRSDLLATFGALEPRAGGTGPGEDARSVDFPDAPQTKSFLFDSKVAKGRSIVLWEIPGPRGNEEVLRRFTVLADILGDRLREEIREKLGASYSPQAAASGSRALDDFGFVLALSDGKPDDVPQLAEVTVDLAASLAEEGATADELDRARQPLLADIEKSRRDNGYWLDQVLSGSAGYPEKLELARNRREDVESITLEEINALAAGHLGADAALRVSMTSESVETE